MLEDMDRSDLLHVVDAHVKDLLARGNIVAPPIDAIALAQGTLGMVICLDKKQAQRGRAGKAAGQRQIYLRPEPTEERHQWTVACEIGEHFKTDILAKLGVETGPARGLSGASIAKLFAQRLLVPECWFPADAREAEFDVLDLKKKYATSSHEVIAWRFIDLPDPCIVTILDNDVIYRRRSNAWPAKRELTPPEKKCQQFVHKRGKPHRVAENDWTVHGWPVHQGEWKREILRSVVDVQD